VKDTATCKTLTTVGPRDRSDFDELVMMTGSIDLLTANDKERNAVRAVGPFATKESTKSPLNANLDAAKLY
jgi:hypothetical protein